ncbi:MAG TPA: EAL domain-containing protein [Pseudoduganella sp.]
MDYHLKREPSQEACSCASGDIDDLRRRLAEAEATLEALRNGQVDALVVNAGGRNEIITFSSGDIPYRAMLEAMQEGAVTVTQDGSIVYCNPRFAAMVAVPLDQLLGQSIFPVLESASLRAVKTLLQRMLPSSIYLSLHPAGAEPLLAYVSANPVPASGLPHAMVMLVMDMTEQNRTQKALRIAEQKYRGIFENAVEGLFQFTVDGHYMSANPALARIYGYGSPEELLIERNAEPDACHLNAERRQEFFEMLAQVGEVRDFETQVRCRDNCVIWVRKNARAIYDAKGKISHYEGSVEDITMRKSYEAQLEYQANFDTLTGLANRRRLMERLRYALAAAERYGHQVAVAFVDLDRFKYVNDTLGHEVGDLLLVTVAQRLQACLREGDTVARQGGDEFVLVIDHSDEFVVTRVMRKLLDSIARPIQVAGHEITVTCSIGFSLYPQDGADATTLLCHADAAMYRAKELGRNECQFFTPELNQRISRRLMLESRLRYALERQELFLEYQPQIDLNRRMIVGVEALLRWRGADGERTIAPSEFIPVAEETGQIAQLGEWILHTACAQNRAWQTAGMPPIRVAVNLSARQFRQEGLHQVVQRVLRETGLEPKYLELELTESLLMEDVEAAIATLSALKGMGVRLSIDDFGTGYSSLSYLKRFPIDGLKIDQSFVRDITSDADDALIAATIITLAHSLNLKVIAEGVETVEQEEFLRLKQCDEIQGFRYSKPLSADTCRRLLEQNQPFSSISAVLPDDRAGMGTGSIMT